MKGNAWRAYFFEYVVTKSTVLEFDFQVSEEAEGHAICLDENLQEYDHVPDRNRCFQLGGSQVWDRVWIVYPESGTDTKHYRINIGARIDNSSPYISPGVKINYLALVQDNDNNVEAGESIFRNIKVYEDTEVRQKEMRRGRKK